MAAVYYTSLFFFSVYNYLYTAFFKNKIKRSSLDRCPSIILEIYQTAKEGLYPTSENDLKL